MISYLNRLRAKKGFTMIELIVVIAIIGVLTSIVVAVMSGSPNVSKARGLARDIYYVSQDAFAKVKLTNPHALDSLGTGYRIGFYAEIGSDGEIDDMGFISADPPATDKTSVKFSAIELAEDNGSDPSVTGMNVIKTKLPDTLKEYLTTSENMKGTLYVVCDKKFRVQVAYWKSGSYSILSSGSTGKFSSDDVLDSGEICAAYPSSYSKEGKFFLGK